jgi:hypothetical protein
MLVLLFPHYVFILEVYIKHSSIGASKFRAPQQIRGASYFLLKFKSFHPLNHYYVYYRYDQQIDLISDRSLDRQIELIIGILQCGQAADRIGGLTDKFTAVFILFGTK